MSSFLRASVLDYARFYGIANDHMAIDPNSLIPQFPRNMLVNSLEDMNQHVSLDLSPLRQSISKQQRERLNISKADAAFLELALRQNSSGRLHPLKWNEFLLNRHRIADIKYDPPLLRTDHESDMLIFRKMLSPDRMEVDLPLEKIDTENDEGLVFPIYIRDLPRQVQERIANEKLDCTREILLFLQTTRKSGTFPALEKSNGTQPRYTKRTDLEPITPPIVPRSFPIVPFIPSSPNMVMELLSEPATPEIPEHRQIERDLTMDSAVFSRGIPESDRNKFSRAILENFIDTETRCQNGPANVKLISPRKRVLSQSLKVDGPLTPPFSVKKRRAERAKKETGEIIKAIPRLRFSYKRRSLFGIRSFPQSFITCRERDIRIQTPTLTDFSLNPPWGLLHTSGESTCGPDSSNGLNTALMKIAKCHNMDCSRQISANDELNLQWNPFPMGISRLHAREQIDNIDLSKFVKATKTENSKYEKLMEQRYTVGLGLEEDFNKHIPKPTLLIEATSSAVSDSSADLDPIRDKQTTEPLCFPADNLYPPNETQPKSTVLLSQFSPMNQLSNFMNIRGKRIQNNPASPPHPAETLDGLFENADAKNKPEKDPYHPSLLRFPLPEISCPARPLTFVISTSFLQTHRSVIRNLEALTIPKTLVFRDYSAIKLLPRVKERVDMHVSLGTTRQVPIQTGRDGDDADVVISPSTAILLTTSQETTQLHLPGHSPNHSSFGSLLSSPLKERIFHVCRRYERLYVLVCHPFDPDGASLAKMASKTFESTCNFISFCSSLAQFCNVIPIVVPTAVEHLTQWIVKLADNHSVHVPWSTAERSSDLAANETRVTIPSNDPTIWELFLYHAGMNCFAAHIVLASSAFENAGQHNPAAAVCIRGKETVYMGR
ncbi:predicted protein [Uncinocarpus reesii 1704]|uniref:Uncharacterized protein n=1 Tax=Uncinocarpus reesii (strain UAMH 1704) TaxID=336963 RepID=C4JPW6_UNCRE|nr:uncharacterized protein UREG_04609 [Uncinocarpus reesii 1704]EEP79763.1 predicted protein [Uncinocarpus reesii 1704]